MKRADSTPGRRITILIAAPLPAPLLEHVRRLSPAIEIIGADEVASEPALMERAQVVYGRMEPHQWARAHRLEWLQAMSTGVDRVLTPEALAHPAVITNVHIYAETIAEHLFAMLLTLTRALHIARHHQAQGRWNRSEMEAADTLRGKTLGILGLGAIGGRTAELGRAFGLRVLGLRRRPLAAADVETVYGPEQKRLLLEQCDYLMATLPLTPRTRHFLGEPEFQAMKPGALLFNVGRGATVDTEALVRALREGRLGGAGLDVTDPEPLPAAHPLWRMPNVIITAHYAGIHPGWTESAGRVFLDNLRRYLAGEELLHVVDKEAGY